jgi:hypothetical protein
MRDYNINSYRIFSLISKQARSIRDELCSSLEENEATTLSPDGRDVGELLQESINKLRSCLNTKSGKFTRLSDNIERLRPILTMFVPQTPEYMVPFACVFLIFKVISKK